MSQDVAVGDYVHGRFYPEAEAWPGKVLAPVSDMPGYYHVCFADSRRHLIIYATLTPGEMIPIGRSFLPRDVSAFEHELTMSRWTVEAQYTFRFSVGAASPEEAKALANSLLAQGGPVTNPRDRLDGYVERNRDADLTITLEQADQSHIPLSAEERFESLFPPEAEPPDQSDTPEPLPSGS